MKRRYVEVALPPPLARELTYGLPDDLSVRPGALVLVPVHRRLLSGVVLRLCEHPGEGVEAERVRDIEQVLESGSLLSPETMELCRWMAEYYFAPLGSALMAALPPGVRLSSSRQVSLAPGAPETAADELEARALAELRRDGPLKVTTLRHRLGPRGLEACLRRLQRQGHVEIAPALTRRPARPRREQHYRLPDAEAVRQALPELESRAPRQAQCLHRLLAEGPLARRLLLDSGFSAAVLKGLCERGLAQAFAREITRDPLAHIGAQTSPELEPTADQRAVLKPLLEALDCGRFYPALLQGVTGSGKTLIYIHLAARALERGRGAIVLVPEIALAWQMVRRFRARFGEQVAVLHSQLSEGERYDTWRRLRAGEQRLVIGARSAILAPLGGLGLVVVDEEHDTSYKQEDLDSAHPLPYNARDVALVRGQRQAALVLLGSATPSLESYWNARAGKYHLHALPHRVDDRPLPAVEIVDMKAEPYQKKKRALFSQALRLKIRQRLERGEKIVLLQNRRGFSPFIVCPSCGEAVHCRSCRVSLTYHRSGEPQMRCHYCDFRAPVPPVCPDCGSAGLRFEGVGTQKVEEALLEQFPGLRVIRMDVDTTGWKGAHDELVERFRRGEADVLLGTQMVAKGLDFPEVTLVGVISADTGLHLPDFRATERSFQLITQVAGRSGRGQIPGEVVVQTLLPDAPVLRSAARQDYEAFVGPELEERRQAGFPPFGRLIVFRWRGAEEEAVAEAARKGVASLRHHDALAQVLGPAPAPLARLRGQYRFQALLRGEAPGPIHALSARALPAMREAARAHAAVLTVNVDPQTMM